jgi:hypothetical protein
MENTDEWGPPVSHRFPRRARLSERRCHVAATRLRRATPLMRLKGVVGTARRRPDSPSDHAPRCPRRRLASRAPIPTVAVQGSPPLLSEHRDRGPVQSRRRRPVSERADAAVYTVRAPVSAPAPPRFSRLPSTLILSLLPVAGPLSATGALASSENAAADLVFLPLPIDKELQ